MKIKSLKGYSLIIIVLILTIFLTSNVGLRAYIQHIFREIGVEEVEHTKGYYLTLAGLRYASILLQHDTSLVFQNHQYIVTGKELGGDFYKDVSSSPAKLVIAINEITSGPNQGQYTVNATYNY